MPNREPVESLLGGKYRILDRLGGGAVGDVYRGENTLTGRPVAIKLLRADFADDPSLITRFFQEVQAVNKIRHPNIVDVLDLDLGESGPLIVMQCLSGDSLAAATSRLGRLSIEATVAIGAGVLDALDAAHRAGILHRDLKPENVFLHRPMADVPVTVKLLDFGISKILAPPGTTPRTHTPVAFGTADYLSPEQALGEPATDGRSDLFSLAIVLFELLTGQRPFRAATAVATAYRVVNAPAPSFAELGRPSHPMLESIIGKALGKRPADRYATAADFARELLHVAPDARSRAEALQEVLGNSSSTSGTLPAASAGVHRSSTPPYSQPPLRSSVSALRPGVTSRPPERASLRPQEIAVEGRTSSTSLPPAENLRASRPPAGREGATTSAPSTPAPSFCHVRGHVLRAADHFIVGLHGASVRDRILARLPARYSDDFRHGSLTGVVLYDLAVFEAYAAAANAVVLGNDPSTWREIGRGSVEGQLASLMRALWRVTDEAALFRRGTTTWSRLLDFGVWSTDYRREGEAVVRVEDLGPAPLTLRQWLIGVVEQTLRHAGHPGTTVTARVGEASRAPELELLIRLRP